MAQVYFDDFKSWEDVASEFSNANRYTDDGPLAALQEIPEPEEVILASYETGNYEGDAWVVYRNGDKFFEVEGGHCSCYGLEGQWEPHEYEKDILLQALEKRGGGYGVQGRYLALVLDRLK